MNARYVVIVAGTVVLACLVLCSAPPTASAQGRSADPVSALVGRLDLERYKATIKGLAQFGDRRQGTDRNRAAVEWIARELASYGCAVERLHYVYDRPAEASSPARDLWHRARSRAARFAPASAARACAAWCCRRPQQRSRRAQTDPALRALNAQLPTPGPREEVYCTKVGTTRPEEMYIVGAHMDGHGFGEAADDDGSGDGAGHGTGPRAQRTGRADRALDPLRAVEQRGDRAQRRDRLCAAARRAAGQGGSAGLRPLSGAADGSA